MTNERGSGTNPSFASRVAITVLLPALVVTAGDFALIPGVSGDALAYLGVSPTNFGVFALGVTPILSAYWVVEVLAFLVPRWSRLRHGNPEGRAKLDRIARGVTLVFAAFQAYGVAIALRGLNPRSTIAVSADVIAVSTPVVVITLVGGVCVLYVVAQWITRRGLLNGFVALLGAFLLRESFRGVVQVLGIPLGKAPFSAGLPLETDRLGVAASLVALAVIVAATWIVLRGAGEMSRRTSTVVGAPYRGASTLSLSPTAPMPSSTFQVYPLAVGLLMLPTSLAALGLSGFQSLAESLADPKVFVVLALALVLPCAWVFSRLLLRPLEYADLVERLGAQGGPEFEAAIRDARKEALLPTLLYLTTIVIAGASSRLGALAFATVVPIAIDAVHAGRVRSRAPSLVPVWEERRVAVVPLLRGALASRGIATEVHGAAFASFWQVFAPYAPVSILVSVDDEANARGALAQFFGAGTLAPPSPPEELATHLPWTSATRAKLLVGTLAVAVLAFGAIASPVLSRSSAPIPGTAARLEVLHVDDSVDPFVETNADQVPPDTGIALRTETVWAGPNRQLRTGYAMIVPRAGESTKGATERLRTWLARTVPTPTGTRFAFEPIVRRDEATDVASVVAIRTYLVSETPLLRTSDVTDAKAMVADMGGRRDVYVEATLSADAAKRFEEFTRTWLRWRLAIIVDDEVHAAPVVVSAITGGRFSVTFGDYAFAEKEKLAKELARRLHAQ